VPARLCVGLPSYPYIQISSCRVELGKAAAPVHERLASRANSDQGSQSCCVHLKICPAAGCRLRTAAAQAIHLAGSTRSLPGAPLGAQPLPKVIAQDERRFPGDRRQPALDPGADCVSMHAEHRRRLCNRIRTVELGKLRVGVASRYHSGCHAVARRCAHARLGVRQLFELCSPSVGGGSAHYHSSPDPHSGGAAA
jgi:hypothetical protein